MIAELAVEISKSNPIGDKTSYDIMYVFITPQ